MDFHFIQLLLMFNDDTDDKNKVSQMHFSC